MKQIFVVQQILAAIFGFAVSVLVIFVAHVIVIPEKETFNPVNTCTQPPLDCWDGYSKPFYKCVRYETDKYIRKGVIFPAGTVNCYKSVYFNVDSTSLAMFVWLAIWFTLTTRACEMILKRAIQGIVRVAPAVAIALSIPSLWYVCSVMIHYLNDRYFPMFYSQIFFTFTEIFSLCVCMLHLTKDGPTYPELVTAMASVSMFHIFQLGMDEPFFISSERSGTIRNLLFLSGDIAVLTAAIKIATATRRNIKNAVYGTVGLFFIFHLFFADEASFSIK